MNHGDQPSPSTKTLSPPASPAACPVALESSSATELSPNAFVNAHLNDALSFSSLTSSPAWIEMTSLDNDDTELAEEKASLGFEML